MNELIKITEKDGQQLVSARELHEFLEVGRDFTTWIKARIEKYEFLENVDFTIIESFHQNGGKGGRPEKDYVLTIEMAKELSMVENSEKGKQARKYFIQCEKKLKEVVQTKPTCIEDVLISSLQEMKALRLEINNTKKEVNGLKEENQNIRDLVALNPNQWREDTTKIINKIATKLGGYQHIEGVRKESYKILNSTYGVDVNRRLLNKKKNMALEGCSKSKIAKVNVLDVIAEDKKLVQGYISIISKLAIKYGI